MEHKCLVGAVVGLVASWVYILMLRAKIRNCVSYIQHRIDQANFGVRAGNTSPRREGEAKCAATSPRSHFSIVIPSPAERGAMGEKPHLIVGDANLHRPFYYQCSHCFQPFSLPGDQTAKLAVEELFRRFHEHVEEEHSNLAPRSDLGAKGQ